MGVCVRHTSCNDCGSSDARAIYEDGSEYCWSCEGVIPSEEYKESQKGSKVKPSKVKEKENDLTNETSRKPKKPLITKEQNEKLKKDTSLEGKGFRGLKDEYTKMFGVRYTYDEATGKPSVQHYPVTLEGKLSGYRSRKLPKDFSVPPIGNTGAECDLFGQFKFKTGGKYCLIVGGEVDQLSAYQMLAEYNKRRGSEYEIPVVSPTVGENCKKQIQNNYKFFDQFEQIILCLDNDEAGKKATEKVVTSLPKGKVKMMQMRYKDPNDYLEAGKESEFIKDFWNAKIYTSAGVYASTQLYEAAKECLDLKMIPLPPFLKTAANMFGGGLIQNEIFLVLARTSIGKTTLMSGICTHFAIHAQDEVVGVLSLEAKAAKFSQNLMSYHLQTPLHRMSSEERSEFLSKPEIIEKCNQLYMRPNGEPSLYVCDDRGASWEQIKEKLLEMIIGFGVTVLIIDPYSDLLSGMSVQEQEEVATWFKKIMKEYGITPIIVSHVRKSSKSKDGKYEDLTEDDAQGSSFLAKASGQTIALERDKMAECQQQRNTTRVNILKNRDFSETGPAGNIYFDWKTANLYDLNDWLSKNAPEKGSEF